MKYSGGCHCGAVKFEVEAPEHIAASEMQLLDLFEIGISASHRTGLSLQFVRGTDQLTTYTFNTGIAKYAGAVE